MTDKITTGREADIQCQQVHINNCLMQIDLAEQTNSKSPLQFSSPFKKAKKGVKATSKDSLDCIVNC